MIFEPPTPLKLQKASDEETAPESKAAGSQDDNAASSAAE